MVSEARKINFNFSIAEFKGLGFGFLGSAFGFLICWDLGEEQGASILSEASVGSCSCSGGQAAGGRVWAACSPGAGRVAWASPGGLWAVGHRVH